jgi:hypothetical protein
VSSLSIVYDMVTSCVQHLILLMNAFLLLFHSRLPFWLFKTFNDFVHTFAVIFYKRLVTPLMHLSCLHIMISFWKCDVQQRRRLALTLAWSLMESTQACIYYVKHLVRQAYLFELYEHFFYLNILSTRLYHPFFLFWLCSFPFVFTFDVCHIHVLR